MSIITGGNSNKAMPQGNPSPGLGPTPGGALSNYTEMKDMIEVKTSNNYQIGKQTINSRIGEDYEPDKPMMTNYKTQSPRETPQDKQRVHAAEISDERLEEIKIQHYNRKM